VDVFFSRPIRLSIIGNLYQNKYPFRACERSANPIPRPNPSICCQVHRLRRLYVEWWVTKPESFVEAYRLPKYIFWKVWIRDHRQKIALIRSRWENMFARSTTWSSVTYNTINNHRRSLESETAYFTQRTGLFSWRIIHS